jgi:xylulokinase
MSIYLGLDSSTQSLSALAIDTDSGQVVVDESVNFAADLPDYPSDSGVLPHSDPLVKHSDPLMWVAALDLLLTRCRENGVDWSRISGIAGSGQQHGSVYLKRPLNSADLSADADLASQIAPLLSRTTSPIWMDSSTSAECAEMADAVGGDARVVSITGSQAIERFTGSQIRKFSKSEPEAYADTGRIHLVSSFVASILCGGDAGIDPGDGAGMNLMDLAATDWSEEMLAATASGLADKLPPVVAADASVGTVADYFVERYGFAAGTPVIAFSGDNPCSLVGMGAYEPGTAVISLGTSDTYFAAMRDACTDSRGYGHAFGNPAGGYMSLICFKNGSLAREAVADRFGMSWDDFSGALRQTEAGNDGNSMLPYFVPEITPLVLQEGARMSGSPSYCDWQDSAAAVRAVVEAQAMSMRLHSDWIGKRPSRILVTGGASQNAEIVQVIADVFGASLGRLAVANSAALGAALRAGAALGEDLDSLRDVFAAPDPGFAIEPNAAATAVYDAGMADFESRVAAAVAGE